MTITISDARYLLIIKGTREDAERECNARSIPFVFVSDTWGTDTYTLEDCTVVRTNAPIDILNKWIGETMPEDIIEGFGYPNGSLLFWNEIIK